MNRLMQALEPSYTFPKLDRKVRVLVFPCGAENALEIHQALRYSVHVELFGASSVDDHGQYQFPRYYGDLPHIHSADFEDAFSALTKKLGIDLVFATHDSVLTYLAPRAQAMGFTLVNGDAQTAEIARSKQRTYRLFAGCPWAPVVYTEPRQIPSWPVVIKPDEGQGGQGVTIAYGVEQAELALRRTCAPVMMEHLPGEELTVDCFTDRHHKLLWIGPRTRERVRAGISMRSRFLDVTPEIEGIATEINQRTLLRGPWFFQLKRATTGDWKLLEFSCRIAGTMVAQRARGINLPLMAIQDYLGRDLTCRSNRQIAQVDRSIVTRAKLTGSYDTVFVDLDDTLITDASATPLVMAFLYQSLKEGKQIKLITRHEHDVIATLEKARIAVNLFDEIIHITDGSSKADHITADSIFIDNHFPERLAVADQCGVSAVDLDALEFLIR